ECPLLSTYNFRQCIRIIYGFDDKIPRKLVDNISLVKRLQTGNQPVRWHYAKIAGLGIGQVHQMEVIAFVTCVVRVSAFLFVLMSQCPFILMMTVCKYDLLGFDSFNNLADDPGVVYYRENVTHALVVLCFEHRITYSFIHILLELKLIVGIETVRRTRIQFSLFEHFYTVVHRMWNRVFVTKDHFLVPGVEPDVTDKSLSAKLFV